MRKNPTWHQLCIVFTKPKWFNHCMWRLGHVWRLLERHALWGKDWNSQPAKLTSGLFAHADTQIKHVDEPSRKARGMKKLNLLALAAVSNFLTVTAAQNCTCGAQRIVLSADSDGFFNLQSPGYDSTCPANCACVWWVWLNCFVHLIFLDSRRFYAPTDMVVKVIINALRLEYSQSLLNFYDNDEAYSSNLVRLT